MSGDDILTARLANFVELGQAETEAISNLTRERTRQVGARLDIIREGDVAQYVYVVLSGWAYRYKTLEDGRRQIIGFLLPGDMFDISNRLVREMDHAVGTITPVRLAELSLERIEQAFRQHPKLAEAFDRHTASAMAVQREWTVHLARNAVERIGHLLCELFIRLRAVNLTHGNRCDLPITQADIAEAMGLTAVHVNRTLQEMRSVGLIILKDRVLEIPDLGRLQQAVLFTSSYLHLDLGRDARRAPGTYGGISRDRAVPLRSRID